jgi:AraC-like DNA-binding protein
VDIANGELHFSARLDSGAPWPFSGVILFLAPHGKGIDLSHGGMQMEIGPSNLANLQACLVEEIPGFTRDDRWQTARYDCQNVDLVPGKSIYDLSLERFLTPDWWYSTSGIRPSQIGPETRRSVVRMVLQTGDGTPLREVREVRIVRLDAEVLHWPRSMCVLAVFCLAGLVHVLVLRRRKSVVGTFPVEASAVVFRPVEAVSYADRERQAVIQHIATAYPDPELSLESVSRATGVPSDRVTSHVKAASGLLFKAYLNRVRVQSARKLLLETDLPVSEVAASVGYGNISHFNRIFREVCGTTPSALREKGAGLSRTPSESAKST